MKTTTPVRSVLLVPVTLHEQAETIRLLRNAARSALFDQRELSASEQQAWWQQGPHRLWLVYEPDWVEGPAAGYVHLFDRQHRTWITLVVDAGRRGRGIGTAMYGQARDLTPEPIWAAMWRWNRASYEAAARAGYREVPAQHTPEVYVLRSKA